MANVLDLEMLKVALRSIDEFAERELPDSLLIDLDERDEFPEELVRRMSSGEELGIQLLFVPFEYGGMGGGAWDCRKVFASRLENARASVLRVRPPQADGAGF